MSTRQYAILVRDWIPSTSVESNSYGTRSMRRTMVAQIYRKAGDLRAVLLLPGHTKMDSAVRHLSVELEDTLAIAEAVEIRNKEPPRGGRPRPAIGAHLPML